jgi:hypothetical protein
MSFMESQCINLVYIDLEKTFMSALAALELFSLSFFRSLSVGEMGVALYPYAIDRQTSNPSACMCVFILLL